MEETRNASAARTRTVLDAPARLGNFTYRRSDNGAAPDGQPARPHRAPFRPADAGADRADAAAQRPDRGGRPDQHRGFRFNTPSGGSERLWGFRVDFNLSERHRFEGVYSNDRINTPNDSATNDTGEPFLGCLGGSVPRRQRASFAWNWVPTSSLTNEVRGGFYRPRSLVTNVEFPEGNRLTFPTIGTAVTNPVQNSLKGAMSTSGS